MGETNPNNGDERVHVYVSGEVQGVAFRYETRRMAGEYGISGWVKNLPDGRVEAVFEGNTDAVRKMVSWCESGPSSADVVDVSVDQENPEGLSFFEVR